MGINITYIKVHWIHDFEDEPIFLYSELDSKRNEIRKIEVYKNGKSGYACENKSVNGTFLSKTDIPLLEDINANGQFAAYEIDKEHFEWVWSKAVKGDKMNSEMEELVERFIDASIKYGEAIEQGQFRIVNKQSGITRKIRKQLFDSSKLDILIPSLHHENDYVKLNVAASIIWILPDDARAMLEELQGRRGFVGFEAEMFLQEWDKGNIRL